MPNTCYRQYGFECTISFRWYKPYILFGFCCGFLYICIMEKHLEKFDNQYSVTDNGIVYSLKGNKKELKGKVTNAGYREVILSHKGNKKYILVHRLVAETFIENSKNLRTVNHKDGNKLNNSVSNLEWLTCQENLKHARDNGLLKTKITKEIAEKIRRLYAEGGWTHTTLGNKFGIKKTNVGYIINNQRWVK